MPGKRRGSSSRSRLDVVRRSAHGLGELDLDVAVLVPIVPVLL
jgi:hypothetical protein